MYTVLDTLELILVGGFFGIIGQVVREIPGLALNRLSPEKSFNYSRLITNLASGLAAGLLGACILVKSSAYQFTHQDIFTMVVVGYAAGDFLERIIQVFSYKGQMRERQQNTATADSLGNADGQKTT